MLAVMFRTRQIALIASALMFSGSLIAKADDGPVVISSETACSGNTMPSGCGSGDTAPVLKLKLPGFDTPQKTAIEKPAPVQAEAPKKRNYDLSGLLKRAVKPDLSPAAVPAPKPRRATVASTSSNPAPYLQALERQAPWVRGAVRWCDAFPSSPHCSEIDRQFPAVPDPKAVSRVYGLPVPQTK